MTTATSAYARLGVRTFINARGTITTLGGSVMPPRVAAAMVEASRNFVQLNQLQQKAGERIAQLTGAEAAYICAGAASGMYLSGAACLTGTDEHAVAALPDTGDRPNEFVISLVDGHYYVHQGFRVCGGKLTKIGTRESVTERDYADGISARTAAVVFFLGSQPMDQLPGVIEVAHAAGVPVIVDAAAQLPPRSNLTDLPKMGVDLTVFSGGKGLFGPQSSGLILGRADLIKACAASSSPQSGVGRGMKVGKEEIVGLLTAVEIFMEQDEEAVIAEWERRCKLIAAAVSHVDGIESAYQPPYANKFPPASPLVHLNFGDNAPVGAADVARELEAGEPSILVSGSATSITVGPQTLQDGEAEIIAKRLVSILRPR
jgi:D-glucosaminate-6-phosphate ammonia-lyase